ncbi:MAG: hypothetical protein Q7S14_01355 [bacterium]|nr:hypothetical protein [bacterium]
MKELVPAKILAVSVVFLAVLYLTSDIVSAVALSLVTLLALHNFLKLGGILFFSLLIYPLVGGYLTAIIGYGTFVVIFHKFSDGRYAFGLALFFLILCPILLVLKKNEVAETSAVFAYLFLAAGAIQEVIHLKSL